MYLRVSREQLRRALLILDALFKEAERRGHALVEESHSSYDHHAGVAISIRGHLYPVELLEITDRVPLSEQEKERWRKENIRYSWQKDKKPPATRGRANERLRLSLPDHGAARQTWSERRSGSLEDRLAAVLEELERRAEVDDRRAEEWARAEAERQRLEDERRQRERLARIEQARAGRLAEEVAAWTLARQARDYVAVLRGRLPELDEDDRTREVLWDGSCWPVSVRVTGEHMAARFSRMKSGEELRTGESSPANHTGQGEKAGEGQLLPIRSGAMIPNGPSTASAGARYQPAYQGPPNETRLAGAGVR